jgi:hypothetical protein
MIRCLFGWHRTVLIEGEDLGLLACRDCGSPELIWDLWRPERQIQAQREHVRVMADREDRAAQMTKLGRPRLVAVK